VVDRSDRDEVVAALLGDPARPLEGPTEGPTESPPASPSAGGRPGHLDLAISQHATEVALVLDAQRTFVHVSASLASVLGHRTEDIRDDRGWDFLHPDDREAARQLLDRIEAEGGTGTTLVRIRDAAGSYRWMETVVANLLDSPVRGLVLNLRDVTERVRAERALRASEARYRAIVDTAYEGIWVCAPEGRTIYANSRMAQILGVELDELINKPVGELLDEEAGPQAAQRLATRAEVGAERYELRYRRPDGAVRVLGVSASPLFDDDGALEGSLAMISDVSDAHHAHLLREELRHSVLHDQLTGLPNRALLLDRLEHALERGAGRTAVLFIDLDHFKYLNDSRGHSVGDALLLAVADRLRHVVRPGDTVARFGGDEFLVVCEDVTESEAGSLAERWVQEIAEPLLVGGAVKHTSASIGVAVSGGGPAADLVRQAETAMYAAKKAGRRRVAVFNRALAEHAHERYSLSGQLRVALAADALTMHYQPVVDLRSGRVTGVEALARWNHPELGWVPPDRFVAVAEETGLAPELDRWALRRAISEAGAMRADGTLPADAYVAVNLSAGNLTDVALEALVASSALEAGLAPQDVVLEITEGAVMANPDVAIALLGRLRQRGFRVALDDFGTGYSSMAYLRRLPLTTLKIDRSFVAEIVDDPEALAIVTSIVQLAHATGVDVVAEGVETPGHAALLRGLGCGAAQGWLWSPAVPPATAHAGNVLTRTYDVGGLVREPTG
jgi:diguanylate cyclase (GGDEF)-like protein/PAS domain S-box-containing protein